MNLELQQLYGTNVCIEDLWLPFYAVTNCVNEPSQVIYSLTHMHVWILVGLKQVVPVSVRTQ